MGRIPRWVQIAAIFIVLLGFIPGREIDLFGAATLWFGMAALIGVAILFVTVHDRLRRRP